MSEAVTEEQLSFLGGRTWIDANSTDVIQGLQAISARVIDRAKWDEREDCMRSLMVSAMPREGRIVVITGAGHLPFFRRHFPTAKFPLARD